MAKKSRAISTLFAVTGMLALLVVGGLNRGAADGSVSDSHCHTHYHTHGAGPHAHGHNHGAVQGVDKIAGSDEGDCVRAAALLHLPSGPHHGCCHEDHSHPAPVFAFTLNGSRWDDHIPSLCCPLPDLWQPTAICSPVIQPIPPPRCDSLGDSISQLRTVVLLT